MFNRLAAISVVVMLAGCGVPEERERNRQPVTSCAGLDRFACGARADCVGEELACIALCVDDGRGGCASPCAETFRCSARPACEALGAAACQADPRCEVVSSVYDTACRDDGRGGCLPRQTPAPACRTRPGAPSCEALSEQACAADARCEVISSACTLECRDDGHGGCLPCVAPPALCRTRAPTASCYGLSSASCVARGDCELVSPVCACTANGPCDCAALAPTCQPREVPSSCYGLSPDACDARADCHFAAPRCDCSATDALCDCPAFEPSCLPVGPCAGLDAATCMSNPRCEVAPSVCTAECRDDGHGGCLPCDVGPTECVERTPPTSSCYGLSPDACDARADCEFFAAPCTCSPNGACDCAAVEPSCQPRGVPSSCYGLSPDACDARSDCERAAEPCACPFGATCDCSTEAPSCQPRHAEPPVLCFGLDELTCSSDPRCELVDMACPAVCIDDGHGGCLPCPTRALCQPRPSPSPCSALDLAACTTDSRCEIGSLVCTTECRDDGQGGCLPCPDIAVCQARHEAPVIGCGGSGGQPPSP